jgi:predicted metalloprotease with PDZ domain
VYEGLTQYLGEILTPRSGLYTPEEFREGLALIAARLDNQAGRAWRPLQDTATAAQLLYEARDDYAAFRRTVDFYDEGWLIWLDADVLIRKLSGGNKSLDDFCKLFHGGPGGAPALKDYAFDDVVAALNTVQPNDWAGFLRKRLDSLDPHAPLGGLENSGWKLAYTSERSELAKAYEEERKNIELSYSLGMVVKEDGLIQDVAMGKPAQKAGIAPSVHLIAIDNRQFSPTTLREAVARTASTQQPLELLIKDGEYYRVHRVDYHGGERYPHLERDSSKPDVLSEIIAAHAK